MTDKNTAIKNGTIPMTVIERIIGVAHDYDAARHLALEALQAFGAILSEAAASFKAWGFASENAARDAIGVEVGKHLEGASASSVRNFISLARSQYALSVSAPDVIARGDYSREVLKALAPVVNAPKADKNVPKVMAQADKLVSSGKASSLAKAVREVRKSNEAPKARVPDWYTSLRSQADKLASALHLVKRGKADAMLTVESFEASVLFAQGVMAEADPGTFQASGNTEGWSLARITAMRRALSEQQAFVNNTEVQYRKALGLQPIKHKTRK